VSASDGAPRLVGKDDKDWRSLCAADTRKYLALGLTGNGADIWLDMQNTDAPLSLGTVEGGARADYRLQGRFGYAWEEAETFHYSIQVKVSIA
jgi:hypothetical protein